MIYKQNFVIREEIEKGPVDKVLLFRKSGSAWKNLAIEEWVFLKKSTESKIFLSYVNEESVILGKHQLSWRECPVKSLEEWSIPLYRRISGGGTVYHDEGNCNYSFMIPKSGFSQDANLKLLQDFSFESGLRTEVSSRGDIFLSGKKLSGNALAYKSDRVLHHGTFLISSDLQRLSKSMKGMGRNPEFFWDSPAVDSNPAKVGNLKDFLPSINIEEFKGNLTRFVAEQWNCEVLEFSADEFWTSISQEERVKLESKYRSSEWNLQSDPRFTVFQRTSREGFFLGIAVEKSMVYSLVHGSLPRGLAQKPKPEGMGNRKISRKNLEQFSEYGLKKPLLFEGPGQCKNILEIVNELGTNGQNLSVVGPKVEARLHLRNS